MDLAGQRPPVKANLKARRVRLAMVAPEVFPLPPTEGFSTAIEFLVQELGEALSFENDVTIFSISHPARKDVTIERIRYRYTSVGSIDRWVLPRVYSLLGKTLRPGALYWQSTGYYASYAAQMGLKIRSGDYEVVHLFNILQFAPWIRRLSPHSKIVFHIAWHGLSKDQDYYGYSVLSKALAERCLKDVDAIIGCSDYLVDGIRERFPNSSQKVFRVHNGVKPVNASVEDRLAATFVESDTRKARPLSSPEELSPRRVCTFC
jgi:hypothetical protein